MQIHIKNIIFPARNIVILFLLIFSFSNGLKAQLVIKNNYFSYEAKSLIQKYFANSGIIINSVTLLGDTKNAIGSFTGGGNAKLGINEGIVITNGFVSEIPGIASDTLSRNLNYSGFTALNTLLPPGTSTVDATVIRINFTPLTDSIWFRYIFASEEFPPFNVNLIKDVFGFFITGNNPSGPAYNNKNLALFPGTSIDIKIDSFANAPYNQYYLHNDTTAIKFNGFTKVLSAGCRVNHCETYTIDIAIGDAGTRYYDSGIFLEAGSFSSTHYSVAVKGTNGENGMVEKCGTAKFIFQRDYILSNPETYNFDISGTAINGTDYTDTLGNQMPNSIIFPANKKTAELKIKAIDDLISEPTETVVIQLPGLSLCISDTVKAVLYLKNTDPLIVTVGNDTTICNEKGETANLVANVTGGVGPYKYYWLEESDSDSSNAVGKDITYGAKPTYDPKEEKRFYLYHVLIYDSCMTEMRSSNDVTVTIKCPIKTTNVITPNGDGYNDKFIVKHLIEYPNSQLVVINRWGKKVFETNNYQNNWDGGNLSDGVYYFIIKLPDGSKYQGSVTIIR